MRQIEGYDVVVVGGGPGGFGAAVASARLGAKTLLIEREGCLGGGMTTMLVHPFMPFTTREGEQKLPKKQVNAGIFQEMIDRVKAHGGCHTGKPQHFDDECMKLVLDEMAAIADVKVLFHTALFDAETAGGRVTAVRLAHNGGPMRATAKVFIDGTGDGLLAAAAGAEFQFGNDAGTVMPMTLNFVVGGVDDAEFDAKKIPLRELARDGGKDNPPLINTNISCTTRPRPGWVHFNAIRVTGNTIDPFDLSRVEAEGRRRVENFVAWLRARVQGFRNCYLVKTGCHVGIRESRRVMGDYVLSLADFDRMAKFEDGICCSSYGIDVHGQKQGEVIIRHTPPGEWYQVPYRCLTPKGLTNLLIAARSISADVMAHSAMRIMPVVMNIGEAAGYAAAMSLPAGEVRNIDVQALRAKIRAAGGILEPR